MVNRRRRGTAERKRNVIVVVVSPFKTLELKSILPASDYDGLLERLKDAEEAVDDTDDVIAHGATRLVFYLQPATKPMAELAGLSASAFLWVPNQVFSGFSFFVFVGTNQIFSCACVPNATFVSKKMRAATPWFA